MSLVDTEIVLHACLMRYPLPVYTFLCLFSSHNTKTTAWVDPRKQFMNTNPVRTLPPHPQPPPTIADVLNGPLPQGWDKAVGSNNEVYFIDHENKKTSWYDPRLRK